MPGSGSSSRLAGAGARWVFGGGEKGGLVQAIQISRGGRSSKLSAYTDGEGRRSALCRCETKSPMRASSPDRPATTRIRTPMLHYRDSADFDLTVS
jgi:hypothetical protein